MLFGIRMIPYGTRYITEAFQSLNKVSFKFYREKYNVRLGYKILI